MTVINRLLVIFIVFAVYLLSAGIYDVSALKKRVPTKQLRTSVSFSSAKLSRSTNSVLVTFKNLASVSKISYELTYMSKGIERGAVGLYSPTGLPSETRNLYFGTCSHAVCTPDTNIKNAQLLIDTTLKNGSKNTKRYIIKI